MKRVLANRLKMQVPVAGATLFGEVALEESYRAFHLGLEKCQYRWPVRMEVLYYKDGIL